MNILRTSLRRLAQAYRLPPTTVKSWKARNIIDFRIGEDGRVALDARDLAALLVVVSAARQGVRGTDLRALFQATRAAFVLADRAAHALARQGRKDLARRAAAYLLTGEGCLHALTATADPFPAPGGGTMICLSAIERIYAGELAKCSQLSGELRFLEKVEPILATTAPS